jgi:hypothetical protein
MATVHESDAKLRSRESPTEPERKGLWGKEWIRIMAVMVLLIGLFAFMLWLGSLIQESAGDNDLQYWLMP